MRDSLLLQGLAGTVFDRDTTSLSRRNAAPLYARGAPAGALALVRFGAESRYRSHTTCRLHAQDAEWRCPVDDVQGHAAERRHQVRLQLRPWQTVQVHAGQGTGHLGMGPGPVGHVHRGGQKVDDTAQHGVWQQPERADSCGVDVEYVL